MKVLVIANCTWRAYHGYVKAMWPEWDIRATILPQAAQWLQEKHEPFLSFLAEVDMAIGLLDGMPTPVRINAMLPAAARRVAIPQFLYGGYQPDAITLHGIASPTGAEGVHSRIVVAAFLAGRSRVEAQALFNGSHYEALGYYARRTSDRDTLIAACASRGIDITESFTRWEENGNFMYLPHHPSSPVLIDVAHQAMLPTGLTEGYNPLMIERLKANYPDYLKDSVLWPVYPEIAEYHGIACDPAHWRSPLRFGGEIFDLDEMVGRSWQILEALPPDELERLHKIFPGGAAGIALAGGAA